MAACVAGVYPLADGLKLIARRARLMQQVSGSGGMAAVGAPEDRVREALRGLEERVTIAAINAPESVVISGYREELGVAERRLRESGVSVQGLNVSHGFHSPQMREMEAAFEAEVREIALAPPRLPVLSSVTGRAVARDEMSQPAYWRRQVHEPVRFRQAMDTLRERGADVFLEVGPGSTLAGLGQQCMDAPEALWLASLRRQREEWPQMLNTLAQLYVGGAEVDWAAFDHPWPRQRLPLPTYPFQRQRYWMEGAATPKTPHPIQAPSDWFYEVAWQPARPDPRSRRVSTARRWLIVPDSSGMAADLSRQVGERGGQSVVASSKDLTARLRGEAYDFVVYLAAAANEDLAHGQTAHLADALETAKAVASAQSGARLWMVTAGAQPVLPAQAEPNLPQAPLWGLGRTVALEHPDCWGGLLDLDPGASADQTCADLLAAIEHAEEDQIALRNGQAYVARLVRRPPPAGPDPAFHPGKTWLITGGLSGLGLEVAAWMAGRGARHLALVSRREPSEEAAAAIEKLRRGGTSVQTYAADVSSLPQMEAVFRNLHDLGGVMHCAGVLDDGVLIQQTAERMERVLAPKIAGAWNLHRLTEGRPLEFFVLFSSIAALTGSGGQASYAAANAFLDALACYRRGKGLTALSINWGGWAETGMAARSANKRHHSALTLMPAALALTAMGQALRSASAQMSIAAIDWHAYQALFGTRPFLSQVEGPAASASHEEKAPGNSLIEQLNEAPESSRLGLIRDFIEALAARVLEFPPGRRIDPRQALTELGLDSLMALELRNALASALSQSLPATLLFNYPAVENVAEYIYERLFGAEQRPPAQQPAGELNDLDGVETLSDEEIDRMLAQRLGAVQ